MNLLLAGDVEPLASLREQVGHATVVEREFTGVGTFTTFAVNEACPRVVPPNFTISDVAYELAGVEHGGGVVLFVRDGHLSMLELYNWTDDWPAEPKFTSIHYLVPSDPSRGRSDLVPSADREWNDLRRGIGPHDSSA